MRAVKTSSSKGITPVVATVLLMTISIAATASAYTFITGTQQQVAENFEEDLRQQELEQQSSLDIEYMYNSTGNFTWMTVRNTGSVPLEIRDEGTRILSLYADGVPVESDAGESGKGWRYTGSSDPDILSPAETLTLNTTETFPARDSRKVFKVVGPYGTSDSRVCFNSGSPSC